MDKLLGRGLLQAGLVNLNTPELIERYNRGLSALGLEETDREVIHIDGAGWSPEVAQDRKSNFYLAHGIINPLAILVTPEQYKKPVFVPLFSWMRGLLRLFFEENQAKIADITATDSISIDFDDGLSSHEGPPDLLLLSDVNVLPNTGGISDAAKEQKERIDDFLEGLNCLLTAKRDPLLASVRTYGDLRRRKLELKPFAYGDFRDFYTVAFEGAAVLRGVGESDLLVLTTEKTYESVKDVDVPGAKIFFVGDPKYRPFRQLAEHGFIEVPVETLRKNPSILEDKKNVLLAWHLLGERDICENEPLLAKRPWHLVTAPQKKKLFLKYRDHLPHVYLELERFAAQLKAGRTPEMSDELWHLLAAPAEHLRVSTREALWILLTRLDPRNVLELYTYDKNHFLEAHYNNWPEQKKDWVAWYLSQLYVPRMNQ